MHAYHEGLAGYSPGQILHDGCDECEARGASAGNALGQMDSRNFRLAWQRAAEFGQGTAPDAARAEVQYLEALWSVQLHLERLGWPIGEVPLSPVSAFPGMGESGGAS